MASSLKSTLGAQVREVRRSRGLTQETLAEQLEMTPRYLACVARGERNLTLDSVDALAKQLGVNARSLLDSTSLPTL